MIAYIKGEIAAVAEDNVVIEVNNIGCNVKISAGTAELLPGIGEEIKIYTYTCVREDAFLLYGFLTKDDLEVFKKLITVNGIGPKGGLSILSAMSADDLRFAVLSGDAKAIAMAPGIGKKMAEKIILDLRDKVSLEDSFANRSGMDGIQIPEGQSAGKSSLTGLARNEAVEALTSLGYSASEALKAVKQVEIQDSMDAEDILKQALKKMS